MSNLPIYDVLPELCDALRGAPKVLLSAPPGSGKTTIVPLELLKQSWLNGRKILMLEPRRLATRAAAARMASLLGESVGETVGYQIRFDRSISAKTRIEVVTEGILTRRLQSDPELTDVGLIIFDEFHERTLHADLALALTLDVAGSLREDLRILVMSATLDTDSLANLLKHPPLIQADGQSFPVELHYLNRIPEGHASQVVVTGVRTALQETEGDILAFLPGVGEIRRAEKLLCARISAGVDIHALYGDLSPQTQDAALNPSKAGRRRIILATSIAETSLTIDGVDVVVDGGWSRMPHFDPNSGLSRLETVRVSKASADQRAGRAGRQGPGVCYRLWTKERQQQLVQHHPPEIANADLSPLVLELAQWGVSESLQLSWVDAPPTKLYEQATSLLIKLQAIDTEGRITQLGQRMASLATHPRLAHMILSVQTPQSRSAAVDLAALLSEKDLLLPSPGLPKPVDIELRLQHLSDWRGSKPGAGARLGIDESACKRIQRAAKQLSRRLSGSLPKGAQSLGVGAMLSLAYPDRIAQLRATGNGSSYLLSSGKGIVLPEGDSLAGKPYVVIPALDAGQRNGRVFSAAEIDLESIRSTQTKWITYEDRVDWDEKRGAVVARTEERLGVLILAHQPLQEINSEERAAALFAGIRKKGITALPISKEHRQWLVRLQLLKSWHKDADWPDVSDSALLDSLESWLTPWVEGVSRLDQLRKLDWGSVIKSHLNWSQLQEMEQLVPTHIRVPSGSNKKLHYSIDGSPVLAVKLQEMFGLMDTPCICNGQIKLVLHLLSPAQRPIQVTQDLKGFWARTYSEVKKELKGRYPKHYWPDDPLIAKAVAKLRPSR